MNDESDSSDDGITNGHSSTHQSQSFDPNPHALTVVKTSTGK